MAHIKQLSWNATGAMELQWLWMLGVDTVATSRLYLRVTTPRTIDLTALPKPQEKPRTVQVAASTTFGPELYGASGKPLTLTSLGVQQSPFRLIPN